MKKLRYLLFVFAFIYSVFPRVALSNPDNTFWDTGWDRVVNCNHLSETDLRKHAHGFLMKNPETMTQIDEWYEDQDHCDEFSFNLANVLYQAVNQCPTICSERSLATDCTKYCDELNEQVNLLQRGIANCWSAAANQNATASGASLGDAYSRTLTQFLTFNNGCWFCPIYKTIFEAVNMMTTTMYTKLRDLFLALVILGTFGWLLWTVLVFITTIHGPNVGELMTTLFKGLGTAMLVSIVLNAHPSFITRYIVDPIAAVGSGLSLEIMDLQSGGNTMRGGVVNYTMFSCGGSISRQETINVCPPIVVNAQNQNMALSQDFYWSIDCLLRRISLELIFGISLGSAIFSHGLTAGLGNMLPDFTVMFAGLVVLFAYLSLYIMAPFKLVDVLIRMGFILILLPVFIAAITTKYTRGYAKKGWEMFVSAWITLIAVSLAIAFSTMLMAAALNGV